MEKEKWQKIDRDEQETIINIDYSNSEVSFYTSKESICNRMERKIWQPIKKYYTKEKISGAKWNNRKIK